MRSNLLFYLLAVTFFLLTAIALVTVVDQTEKSVWSVATVVLGLFSLGLGYYQRPKAKTVVGAVPEVNTAETVDPHLRESHIEEAIEKHSPPTTTPASPSPMPTQVIAAIPAMTPPAAEQAPPLKSELFAIKGIGEKRAAQLNALGINNLDDLAKTSPQYLADNLSISPKITQKWVENAKERQKQL